MKQGTLLLEAGPPIVPTIELQHIASAAGIQVFTMLMPALPTPQRVAQSSMPCILLPKII